MGADYKVGSLGKKKLSIEERICAYISYAELAKPTWGGSKSSRRELACCDRESRATITVPPPHNHTLVVSYNLKANWSCVRPCACGDGSLLDIGGVIGNWARFTGVLRMELCNEFLRIPELTGGQPGELFGCTFVPSPAYVVQ